MNGVESRPPARVLRNMRRFMVEILSPALPKDLEMAWETLILPHSRLSCQPLA